MKITPKHIGNISGIIAANLFSPSWLVMPVVFQLLLQVTGINFVEALTSPEGMITATVQLQSAIIAQPLEVMSVLIGCLIALMVIGFGYTYLMAIFGGRLMTFAQSKININIQGLRTISAALRKPAVASFE